MTTSIDIDVEVLDLTTMQDTVTLEVSAQGADVSVIGVPEIELVDEPVTVEIEAPAIDVEISAVGTQGAQGESGSSLETLIAGETLSGHRVVASQPDGTVKYASNTNLADATRQLWLTLGAALEGDTVRCQPFGQVVEQGWSWADAPILLGANGVLTQTPPTPPAVFFLQVAAPDGPTALIFNPRNPFQL